MTPWWQVGVIIAIAVGFAMEDLILLWHGIAP
jgi:hypothetical protein